VIRQDDERDSTPLLLERTSGGEGPRGVEGPLAEETAREARVGAPSDRPPDEPPAPPPGAVRAAVPAIASTRLGAAGLLIAALLVLLAVFAELLASDLPIACHYGGRIYLFPNVTRPAELTNVPAGEIASFAAWSVYPLVRHDPREAAPETARPLLSPGTAREHPLGTDRAGRDVFARMIHGTRSYLVFALLAVMASLAFGALFGGLAGILGGGTDALVGRAIETVSAFPPLVLVIGIQAAVPRPTLTTLFLAIALTRWPQTARLVRGEVMLAATRDYVLAARALGASPLRVLRRHITPNIRGPLIVASAIGVSAVVLTEASLDYLRIGPADAAASWGETMSQFRDAPSAWWLLAFPGALLFFTVIGLNLLGEALRGALDPRSR
jgi:peptide/nickel transport system permease protein